MAFRLFDAKPLPEQIMPYFKLDPRKKLQWNLNRNSNFVIVQNSFKIMVWKMSASYIPIRDHVVADNILEYTHD